MKNENNSPEDVEKRLQKFFDKKSEELKAPSDLWAKLEPGLDDPKKKASPNRKPKRLFNWFAGPRLIGVASAAAVVLLLVVTGLVWVTADNDNNNASSAITASVDQYRNDAANGQATYGIMYGTTGAVGAAGAARPAGPKGASTEMPVPTATPSMSGITLSPDAGPRSSTVTITGNGFSAAGSFPTGVTLPAGPKGDTGANGVFSLTTPPDNTHVVASIDGSDSNTLDTAQRQVISTAAISLEVKIVDTAISQVQAIAESLGGHLEQMSSSGSEDNKYATATIRVPQAQFFAALNKLQALGKVQSQNVGSQDVTEQYIDLNARLKSAQEEEQSLLSLLGKTQTITDIITLENELSQVRSNIESIQGQLNYIERRVDLATIDVSLSTPSKVVGNPPSGSMTIAVHNIDATISSIKGLVSSVKGEMGQVSVSVNNGDQTATLSFTLYRADFDKVMASIERQGKIQQKYIQEGTTPEGASNTPAEKPDSYVSLTLIGETGAHGFWTSGHIAVISITGGTILILLVAFLYVANRKGLLNKSPEQPQA